MGAMWKELQRERDAKLEKEEQERPKVRANPVPVALEQFVATQASQAEQARFRRFKSIYDANLAPQFQRMLVERVRDTAQHRGEHSRQKRLQAEARRVHRQLVERARKVVLESRQGLFGADRYTFQQMYNAAFGGSDEKSAEGGASTGEEDRRRVFFERLDASDINQHMEAFAAEMEREAAGGLEGSGAGSGPLAEVWDEWRDEFEGYTEGSFSERQNFQTRYHVFSHFLQVSVRPVSASYFFFS
jgi:hypothetical protein